MNKRTVLLIALAVVVAALYLTFFTDVFKAKKIQIMWRILPGPRQSVPTVAFYLDKPYALTSVKVVDATEASTNKFAHPLWYLVAASNASATKGFVYGGQIPGMKPDVPSMQPEALQPDTSYALIVEAGHSLTGKVTFHP